MKAASMTQRAPYRHHSSKQCVSCSSLQLGIQACGLCIKIPNELWGAASLIFKISPSVQSVGGSRAVSSEPGAQRDKASVAKAISADYAFPEYSKDVIEALDAKPSMTWREKILCYGGVSVLFLFLWRWIVASSDWRHNLVHGIGAILTMFITRTLVLERHYAALQRNARDLGFPNSEFVNFEDVVLHVTSSGGTDKKNGDPVTLSKTRENDISKDFVETKVHCLHGFGASVFSWSFIQNALADSIDGGAKVTAHDMPGFGLSQRPAHDRPYSTLFNAMAAISILNGNVSNNGVTDAQTSSNGKRILIGHSMGSCAVAEAAIECPGKVDKIVLVAPAIVALWLGIPANARGDRLTSGAAWLEEILAADNPGTININIDASSGRGSPQMYPPSQNGNLGRRFVKSISRFIRLMGLIIKIVFMELARILLLLTTPLLLVLLRFFVRSREFWEKGLASAWFDKSKISSPYINAYRVPQLISDWDWGILKFLKARFGEKKNFVDFLGTAVANKNAVQKSQAERLAEACRNHNIKVMIIHGEDDVLVPIGNSRRLHQLLQPYAKIVEFAKCGHMPHEEKPEQFVQEVASFINDF